MANNVVSLDTFDLLFADFVQSSLGLQDDQVLISYQEKGQKSSKINENVIYVKTFNEQDEINLFKNRKQTYDEELDKVITTQSSMRVLMLHVTSYGPDSETLLTTLNELMYLETAKEFLYNNNLALIPMKTSPAMNSYEKINERWWHREDLKLYFYNSVTVEENVGTIEKVNIENINVETHYS